MSGLASSEAIRAALKGFDPTLEQWGAIAHPLEPLYLIAGAGSGKTAIMAARIAWIIENRDVLPSQILGLTFTNKAAEELEDRVRRAIGVMGLHRGEDITVQTYHAFAAGVVRDHGLLVGVEPEAGLLSDAQQWQMVLSCMDELPAFEAIELRSSAGIVKATLALASSLADHITSIPDVEAAADRILSTKGADEEMITTAHKRKELCRAVAAYLSAKKRHHRIDFGDQVTKAVEVLEGHLDVRAQYRERFPVVLLDEYQDTNVAQRRLIQALVEKGDAVTAVGDARQAIYAFRGATMYNLIGFPDHFPRADGARYGPVSLSENFRSGRKILEVANSVVDRIDVERRPGAPLRPYPANGEGHVSLGLFGDERAEATWIAAECKTLFGSPAAAPGDEAADRPPVEWRDIAILVRRKAAMDPILEVFAEHDIPVEVVGLGGLLKTPEVTEIVSWLRCLETRPGANRWLARVLMGPRWRIHYRDLALCAHWASNRNLDLKLRLAGGDPELARDMEPGDVGFALVESLDHIDSIDGLGDEARRRLVDFSARLAALRKRASAPLLELVQHVIRSTGIGDALDASPSRAAAAARQNVANFLDHVAAFAPVDGAATLRSLIDYLDAAESAEETLEASQPAEGNSVKLMTVHAAKGLEFECVFVPSVAATKNRNDEYVYSVFPNKRASNPLTSYTELPYEVREDRDHLPRWTGKLKDFSVAVKGRVVEDERRLFYVALTRAKQRLAVTAAWWYGRDRRAKGPSEFWVELAELADSDLIEIVTRDDEPERNPMFEALEDKRRWPPIPRVGLDDPLFHEGWGRAADGLIEGSLPRGDLLDRLPLGLADEAERGVSALTEELDLIASAAGPRGPATRHGPEIISATDLARLLAGEVAEAELRRPSPQRPSQAARLGTEIHRLIEERSRDAGEVESGVAYYPEESELDEPGDAGAEDITAKLAHLDDLGYQQRRLARLPSGELMVELPFSLRYEDRVVRGRIDAVYETDDGGYEIVDFKSGQRFEPGPLDQLAIYARALSANGLLRAGAPVILTYAFLDGGPPMSRPWKESASS